ncbi:MAG TPA: ComEC/Rec2 family competence protein, partial [candidate division Zixibacteria bacterium]|nr:ComEC/Rec2 family competence protein [candidate division Zixibacteria bacterium]
MFSGGAGSGVSSYAPSSSSLSFARRRPAVVALGAVACGVALGQTSALSHWWWLAGALALGAAQMGAGRRRLVVGALALGALALVSAFRAGHQAFSHSDRHIRRLADTNQTYTLFVTISDWPDVREQRTALTVEVDSVRLGGVTETRYGGLLINIGVATHDFQYSDQLILSGRITSPRARRNPGGFDYARYLRWRNIFGIVYLPHHFGIQRNPETPLSVAGIVRTVRGFILDVFRGNLEAEQSALASGFLIGETAGISDRVYHHFRNSGTLHLLAV